EKRLAAIEATQQKPRVIGKEGEFDVQMPPSSVWTPAPFSPWTPKSANFSTAQANYNNKMQTASQKVKEALAKQKAIVSAKSGTRPNNTVVPKAGSKGKGYKGGFRGRYAEGGVLKAQQGSSINYLPIGIDKERRN